MEAILGTKPILEDAYWDYFWNNIASQNRYNIGDIDVKAITNNCLKNLIINIQVAGRDKLQDMIQNQFIQNGADINLIFKENAGLSDPARFIGLSGTSNVNATIELNPTLLRNGLKITYNT